MLVVDSREHAHRCVQVFARMKRCVPHRCQTGSVGVCMCVSTVGWLTAGAQHKKNATKRHFPYALKGMHTQTHTCKFKATTLHKWEEMQHKDNISARNSGHGLKQSKRTGQWKLIYFPLKCRLMAFQMPAGNHLSAHIVYCCGESEMHFNI